MTETPLLLADGFATPTPGDWEAEVLKILNRRRPEGKELNLDQAMDRLRTTTVDGLKIEPLYTEHDAPLGEPGVVPFTRGTTIRTGQLTGWDVCALHEDPEVGFTNKEVLADLERGATSLWLRTGADAIAPSDLAGVLDGVDTDLAAVSVSSYDDQQAAAQAMLALFKAAGTHHASGNLGLDALAFAVRNGGRPELGSEAEWVRAAMADYRELRALTVDVTCYDDAGAGDIDQVGFALASGVTYLRELEAAGITPAAAFGQITFRVTTNADQFTSIARLRALRRAWARIGEVCGVPAERRGAVQHAVTSWRMITRDDPWVNLLRNTIATFAAAIGGAEIITTLPFDTALGLPDDFSRRMARNTQLVAGEEANIGRVNDPAGGSWYVENLTDQLAEKAWAVFTEIEAAGGMATALTSGLVADRIAATNLERARRLADRSQPLTGVSMFPKPDEEPRQVRPRPVAAVRGGLKPVRDAEVFEALRDRAAASAETPTALLVCLGSRRDFGARETFTTALLGVAGIGTELVEGGTAEEFAAKAAGARFAVLCSSAKVYAEHAVEVAAALKQAGVETVYLAGRLTETGSAEAASVIDGEIYAGMDVVAFLNQTLDRMGGAA